MPRAKSTSPRAPRAARLPAGAPLADEPLVTPMAADSLENVVGWPFGQVSTNGYQSAAWTRDRAYVYFPQLDTRKELTTYTRTETLRRVRYLCANVGFARRVLHGIPRMVAGTGLIPRFMTSDKEWNRLALQNFENRTGTPAIYDVGRRYNFASSQVMKLHCRYRDGDMGIVLTESAAGLARLAFFESHQIGSGQTNPGDELSLFDGVRVDRNNAAVSYRLLGSDRSQTDVPVENFIYFGKYSSPGAHRAVSILAAAANHLLDWTEIDAALKSGIKASSRIGYYIGKEIGASTAPGLKTGRAPGGTQTVTDLFTGASVKTERVFASAGGEIPNLPPGQDIKQLLDTRPHPNSIAFFEHLARDMSWGVDLSPEILWNIAALGGANSRIVLADAQSFVEQEQQHLVDTDLGRELIWITAKEMKAGRLRPCADPMWWVHDWIPPARWTADYGRDGKLYLEQVKSGALTFRRYFGMQGLNSDAELGDWMDEYKQVREGAAARGLDPIEVLNRLYQRTGMTAGVPPPNAAADTAAAAADGGDPLNNPEAG